MLRLSGSLLCLLPGRTLPFGCILVAVGGHFVKQVADVVVNANQTGVGGRHEALLCGVVQQLGEGIEETVDIEQTDGFAV